MAQDYDLDVLIVGRGGGSIEDLWNFNEEKVARAIFASRIPIISAVGHEIDFTIADFVADMRAPTPTGAAEMAVPNLTDLTTYLEQLSIRGKESINKKINYQRLVLDSIKNSYVIKTPMVMYENRKQKLDLSLDKLNSLIINKVNNYNQKLSYLKSNYILKNPESLYKDKKNNLGVLLEKLELVSPIHVLKRGYSVTKQDDKIVKSIKDIKSNKPLVVKLYDGEVETEVKNIIKE
jgi:exodeoxyribonuclease VII large subunit